MSTLQHISHSTFQREVLKASVPVLVDFYADWCGPCRAFAPLLERLAGEFSGRVTIVKINVDREPELAQQFQIESIPSLLFFHQGQMIGRTAGAVSEANLRQVLLRLAGPTPSSTRRVA